jgi:hypothetical protein
VNLRDDVEAVLASWDTYERNRGASQVIDYDCRPEPTPGEPVSGRFDVFEKLLTLQARCTHENDPSGRIAGRIDSDLDYLRALMGERAPLHDYVRRTQGCQPTGWPEEYILYRAEVAQQALAKVGVAWDHRTQSELSRRERAIATDQAPDAIRAAARELEPAVRKVVASDAPYSLTIEPATVDAYWAYWLDGARDQARLRLNLRNAEFTDAQARQFALHEILGHALQGASFFARWAKEDVPWVRLLSVHTQQQVLLEGLAQAFPMFVCLEDDQLIARVRLAHFTQLVRAELHIAINDGWSVEQCIDLARSRAPFLKPDNIADVLHDRSVNPQLRSYLWAYPAGIDWFVSLAEHGGEQAKNILHAAYREPLAPTDLQELWPQGPRIGGWNEPPKQNDNT